MSEPSVRRLPDAQALAASAAAEAVTVLAQAQAEGRVPELVLTGGSMGSAFVAALVAAPGRDRVDWSRVQVWWGDERFLPAGDADRNDTQNGEAGLDGLGLSPGLVHRVPGPDTAADAAQSARQYAVALRHHSTGSFDLLLLGVGPDGHVASLFPHHEAQWTTGADTVDVHDSPKPPPERVTLTFEALARARQAWLLVSGTSKTEAVARALAPGAERWDVPAAGVRGTAQTVWWLDEEAAAQLPPTG